MMKKSESSEQNNRINDFLRLLYAVLLLVLTIYLIYFFGYKRVITSPSNPDHSWNIFNLFSDAGPQLVSFSLGIRCLIDAIKRLINKQRFNVDEKSSKNPDDEI